MSPSYRCPFAKALLNNHSRCQYAESFHIAERHGIQCKLPAAQANCEILAQHLHEQSRFALGVTHLPQQLTSNMELRIQCGGINGVQRVMSEEQQEAVPDIYNLVQDAIEKFGALEQLPYSKIVQSISQWKPKRRSRRRD